MRSQRNKTAAVSWMIPLFLLTQSSAALAQSKPVEPIYSDQWISKEVSWKKGDALFWSGLSGAVCGAVGFFGSMYLLETKAPKFPTSRQVPLAGLIGVGALAGCGYQVHSYNVREDYIRFLQEPMTRRILAKLQLQLTQKLENSKDGKGPYGNAVLAKGYKQVNRDIGDLLQSAFSPNGTTAGDLVTRYNYLLTSDDRELIQYLFMIRRAEAAGIPPTAVSNVKGKRPTILNPIGGSDAPGANSAQ